MIRIAPFDDAAALPMFRALDPHDFMEAELMRGKTATPMQMWADWRAASVWQVVSLMAFASTGATTPFAIFALGHTGQAGVAQAALLARDHIIHRRPLARLAVAIRRGLPTEARARGIRRIEARAWAGHPTASTLLAHLGFAHECDMPGFGPDGGQTYRQFALTIPPANPNQKGS